MGLSIAKVSKSDDKQIPMSKYKKMHIAADTKVQEFNVRIASGVTSDNVDIAADTKVQEFNVRNLNNAKIASGVTSDNVDTIGNGNFEAVTNNVQSVPDNAIEVKLSTVAMDKNAMEIVQSSTNEKVMDGETNSPDVTVDPKVVTNSVVSTVQSVGKDKDVVK